MFLPEALIPQTSNQRPYVLVETDSFPSQQNVKDPFDDSDQEDSEGEQPAHDVEQPATNSSNKILKRTTTATTKVDPPSSNIPSSTPQKPPQPPLNERNKIEFFAIVFGAVFLSVNAGFMNGTSFHMAMTAITHVTGSTTRAGLALGMGHMEDFSVFTAIVFSFIFGSLITGRFVHHSSFHLGIVYGPLFLIGSLLLVFACVVALVAPETNAYFYFAAMASGLQNSMTTKYSGNILRTTHMTGTATDIGLILGRLSVGDDRERWKLHVLVPMFVGFFFGGVLSVPAWYLLGRYSLILNALVFFFIGLAYSIIIAFEFNISVWKAFVGFYQVSEQNMQQVTSKVKQRLQKPKQPHKRRPLATEVDDDSDDGDHL